MEPTQRVLAVCEQNERQQSLSRILGAIGLQVSFVNRDRERIEEEIAQGVSVVLFDCETGRCDGLLPFVKWLKGDPMNSSAAVLVLADGGLEQLVSEALELGADGFIFKPFADAELRVRVSSLLSLQNSTDPITPREQALGDLLALTQKLVSSLDFQEILYTIVKRIAEIIQVDRVSIVLVPEEQEVGFVVATSDDAAISHLRIDLKKYPEIQHVFATKAPLVIEDVESHPVLDGVRASVRNAGLTALTVIPVAWEDQVKGALFIRSATHRGVLTPRQMFACQTLVNATAIALRNAEVMQKLRHEAQSVNRDREETEKQLQSLRRYADVFVSTEDGIAVFDQEGKVLMANLGVAKILGYSEQEVLGRPLNELLHEEVGSVAPELFKGMPGDNYPKNFDVRARRKDGQIRTISCSVSSLGPDGRTALTVFRDVSEARKTREELVKTKNFLESLIENSVDAIVATDRKGTIILYNRAAERLFGWRVEKVLHRMNVKNLYLGDGAAEVGRQLRGGKEGTVGRVGPIRMEAIHSGGDRFPISLTAAYIYEQGEHAATFGIFTDLRERERVERDLAIAQQKIASSEKQTLLAELAGATAHELNQPLTGVMGYAELLSRKLADHPDAAKAAQSIHREAERMAEIVRKIGKLTKYETQSYVGKQRILDINRASEGDPDNQTQGDR